MNPSLPTVPTSFYARVDNAQREKLLEAYLVYLKNRNGQLEPETGKLPNREVSLQAMNVSTVRFAGEISQSVFDRLYTRFSAAAPELTRELLVLLTFCKMNAGEAYGVRVVKAVHARRKQADRNLASQAILFAQEEEEYHTRILVGAAVHFGIRAEGAYSPTLALRVLINSLAYAPKPLFHPILFGAEVAGVYVFNWTLNQIRSMIPGQPELAEALEKRLIEVLVDEIGHVALNRLVLGEFGRGIGRFLAGQTVRGLPIITPELTALGFDRTVQRAFGRFDLHDLPQEVINRGFFA